MLIPLPGAHPKDVADLDPMQSEEKGRQMQLRKQEKKNESTQVKRTKIK